MDQTGFLEELRKIRNMETLSLKPSPFLRENFIDDAGTERPVVLREYQKKHIFEMLQVTRHLNGSSTGLGKTIEVLAAITYILMKEPEYTPIIITKKSALHQWAAEVNKFLQDVETFVINGDPFERDKQYFNFFESYDIQKRRLLILTYDVLLKDAHESVVRKKDHKSNISDREILKNAQKAVRILEDRLAAEREAFESWFNNRPYEIWDHAKSIINGILNNIAIPCNRDGWIEDDSDHLKSYSRTLAEHQVWVEEVKKYKDLVAPTIVIPGLIRYLDAFTIKYPKSKFMLVMDEAHVVKNYRGKIHAAAAELSRRCDRVYGLTATPVKNKLMEFFSIFKIIVPELFPKVTWFQNEYCITKLQRIGGGRSVPIVVGYKNLDKFVKVIEPYYLARQKHEVAAELPQLVTRELQCELTELQEELYEMAELGLLEKDSDPDKSSAAVLGAMTYVQEAADSPNLLKDAEGNPISGNSPKIETIIDLLEDELDGVKTIIFSRFERMISELGKELEKKNIKYVRITGKENKALDREEAKQKFQNLESSVNVILITEAGSESINLQAAEHFILIDSPWSYGTYVQLIGRMIRIGSRHQMVVATHLVATHKNGSKTIDHYVIKKLKDKKKLADKVAGESLKDGLEFVPEDDTMEIVGMIRQGYSPDISSAKDKEAATKSAWANRKLRGAQRKNKKIESGEESPSVAHDLELFDI